MFLFYKLIFPGYFIYKPPHVQNIFSSVILFNIRTTVNVLSIWFLNYEFTFCKFLTVKNGIKRYA